MFKKNCLFDIEVTKAGVYTFIFFAFIYMFWKIILTDPNGLDFRLIWLSGEIWRDGLNPYGEVFKEYYLRTFGEGPNTHFWVYPPNWAPISMLSSLVDFNSAVYLWRVANFLFLLVNVIFLVKIYYGEISHALFTRKIIAKIFTILALVFFFDQLQINISLGQTAVLISLGLTLFFYGFTRNSIPYTTIGVVLMLLKPQVAFPVLLVGMFIRPVASYYIYGVLVTCLLTAVSFYMAGGGIATVSGFLSNLERYSSSNLSANMPYEMTGLSHLVFGISGNILPFYFPLILSFFLPIIGYYLMFAFRGGVTKEVVLASMFELYMLTIAAIVFIVPLHTYDLVLLIPFFVYAVLNEEPHKIIVYISLGALIRSNNLGEIFGFHLQETHIFYGSLICSIVAVVLLVEAYRILIRASVSVKARI